MSDGIKKMTELAKENEAFKKELHACKTKEEAASLLKQNNINVTLEELKKYSEDQKGELSDKDLENVSGAGCMVYVPTPW